MIDTPLIVRFRNRDPRRNLPASTAKRRGEANFVGAFERAFLKETSGIGGRQFAFPGFGIADYIWVPLVGNRRMTFISDKITFHRMFIKAPLIAFEMKLRNWRRALNQAYRYSYFADHSIVVLPKDVADRIKNQIDLFRVMGIGLWSLDPKQSKIRKILTPARSARAKSEKAREKAFALICSRLSLRELSKQPHRLG